MRKVLLTGASGFIACHCIPFLLKQEYEVHGVYLNHKPSESGDKLHWHKCDLLNTDEQNSLVEKINPSDLLHFAWVTTPGEYWSSQKNFDWLKASVQLFEKFYTQGGEKIVTAGTCAEYEWNNTVCHESSTKIAPNTVYGECKNNLHNELEKLTDKHQKSSAWGRIFYLFGPNENEARLIPSVVTSLLNNQAVNTTDGEQTRDFLYVKDVADVFVTLLKNEFSGPINIGSGEETQIKDLILKTGEILDQKDLINLGARERNPSDVDYLVADVSQLKEKLSWSPKYNLDSALNETISWWKNHLNKE